MWQSLLVLMLLSANAFAAGGKFGVGFIVGAPTALSGKYIADQKVAYDAQLAFGVGDYLLIYGDYLWQFPGLFTHRDAITEHLTPYVGVGPVLGLATKGDHEKGPYFNKRSDSVAIGVRVPFGIEWMGDKVPIGVGLELAPGIVILPATVGMIQGGLTVRYYF